MYSEILPRNQSTVYQPVNTGKENELHTFQKYKKALQKFNKIV